MGDGWITDPDTVAQITASATVDPEKETFYFGGVLLSYRTRNKIQTTYYKPGLSEAAADAQLAVWAEVADVSNLRKERATDNGCYRPYYTVTTYTAWVWHAP